MKGTLKQKIGTFSIITILSLFFLSSCKTENSDVKYIPVQLVEGGAWSFINEKGERIGTQEWEFEPTVTIDNIFTAKTDSGLVVYRWDKDVAKPIDSLQNLVSVGVLSEGLLPVTPALKRIKIVDTNGNTKFTLDPINGQEISSCASRFSEGLLVVTTVEGKSGVVDKDGKVIYEPTYSEISNFNGGYAIAANYDYDNWEAGPTYFILDAAGNATKVNGKFGYFEGECSSIPTFENGIALAVAPLDSARMAQGDYEQQTLQISTSGEVTPANDSSSGYTSYLDNGANIKTVYGDSATIYTWTAADGQKVMELTNLNDPESPRYNISAEKRFVTVQKDNDMTIYNQEGEELNKISNLENAFTQSIGGNFGLAIAQYSSDYESTTYSLYDEKGQPVAGPKFYGIGIQKSIDLYTMEEYDCGQDVVSSAYIDVTVATSKLSSMIDGNIKGRSSYYIGQAIKDILDGENARFYSGTGRKISLPTNETGQLASGPGFWINGMATSSADIVAPTYQHYFQVAYYDYYGRAWGWNRQKQVGVHFNSNAKVASFDLALHTNYPSGTVLRQAMGRRLKNSNYSLVKESPNYDEYSNGFRTVIIYGNDESRGIGAIFGDKISSMSEDAKSSLVTSL